MGQASIYWDMHNYAAIEKIFRKSFEFCSDHDTWRLNVGHVLFMQESSKYKKAIDFYAPIVKKHYDNVSVHLNNLKTIFFHLKYLYYFFKILNVSPIVLANLCVTYVMCSQNEEV